MTRNQSNEDNFVPSDDHIHDAHVEATKQLKKLKQITATEAWFSPTGVKADLFSKKSMKVPEVTQMRSA